MEFEAFYTQLVIENRLLPPSARDTWIAIQSAISHHFTLVYERTYKTAASSAVPAHMLFNMWIALVHYYLGNGDLFAPEGNVLQRYGNILTNSFLKLLPETSA
jgi:hypothetical protein